jgi:predicted MFS family arabinose efflux permease
MIAMSIWGVGIGGMMYVSNLVRAEYFAREAGGAIRGFATPLVGANSAAIAGYVLDQVGSYDIAWWTLVGLMLICAMLMGVSHPPSKPI